MQLDPGEAAILIIRRSESEPEKYFLSVRRSASSFSVPTNDFELGAAQIPVAEFGEPIDFDLSFSEAVSAVRAFGPVRKIATRTTA